MRFTIETRDPVRLEIFEVLRRPDGSFGAARDPDRPDLNAPATVVNDTYAPPIDCRPGQFFIVKVGN
jgi:hypothetical protein